MVKWVSKVFTFIKWVAASFLACAFVLCAINSLSRYALSKVIIGAEEIVAYLVVSAGFCLFPVLEGENDQLCIDFLLSRVKNEKAILAINIFRGVLTIFMCCLISYLGYECIGTAVKYHSASATLGIPKVVLYSFPTGGFALAAVAWILKFIFNKGRALK